jgi:hypothetical protein
MPERISRAATADRSPCATVRWNVPSLATSSRLPSMRPGKNTAITGTAPASAIRWDQSTSTDLNRIFAADLGSFSGMARTENQVFHRQRYREAVEAVGKIGSHVLESAVCREIALEQVGYSLGWGSRAQAYAAAAERMKDALDALCKLWGIG